MARCRHMIYQDFGIPIQIYDTLPMHHDLHDWDKYSKHLYLGLDLLGYSCRKGYSHVLPTVFMHRHHVDFERDSDPKGKNEFLGRLLFHHQSFTSPPPSLQGSLPTRVFNPRFHPQVSTVLQPGF